MCVAFMPLPHFDHRPLETNYNLFQVVDASTPVRRIVKLHVVVAWLVLGLLNIFPYSKSGIYE